MKQSKFKRICVFCGTSHEYAAQYAVGAALATLEKDKKDLLHKLLLQGLDITILGCNDFYSYRNQKDVVKGKVLKEVIGDVLNGKWDHERTTQKRISNILGTRLLLRNKQRV
ncbi:unnamed protein product [Camellia sinensis]